MSIQRGVELRREGRNGEALVEFQKAFALDPSPRARAQIALALQALGDWLGAEQWLTEALQAGDDAWIVRYRTELDSALATIGSHLGSLSLHVDAQEGEVLVNGAPAQALPSAGPIRVVAGSVNVVVRVPGHADSHRVIDVPAGGLVSESMEVGAALPGAGSPPPPSPATAAHEAPPTFHPPVGAYVALGSAGALTIGGVVAWTIRQSAAATWNDDAQCLKPGETRVQQCGTYLDTANGASALEIIAFSAAAVSAGIGVWLLLHPAPASASAADAWCSPGPLGVTCAGAF